jgi:hypothetical protein
VVTNAAGLIEFAQKAFNAVERLRSRRPEGSVAHAEIQNVGTPPTFFPVARPPLTVRQISQTVPSQPRAVQCSRP